jgi:hypothetical protein
MKVIQKFFTPRGHNAYTFQKESDYQYGSVVAVEQMGANAPRIPILSFGTVFPLLSHGTSPLTLPVVVSQSLDESDRFRKTRREFDSRLA